LIPFEGMPHVADPPRGWIATANARPAPDDFPYPLSGTWSDDLRSRRIRDMILETPRLTRDDFAAMHQDALSLRAVRGVPPLVKCLQGSGDRRLSEASERLQSWDCRLEIDRVGVTLFDVFFANWIAAVARERFQGEAAALLSGGVNGLAAALLEADAEGWFAGRREAAIRETMSATLDFLSNRLGPEMETWTWGRLHTIPLRHVLSVRGELGQLLDGGGEAVKGGLTTVCNVSPGPDWTAKIGAGYRLIADLASTPPVLHAIDVGSQSGHPGSPHYGDQIAPWLAGHYHALPLDSSSIQAETRWTLEPAR
jgi:penicillin amidase